MSRLGRSQPFKPLITPGMGRVQMFNFNRLLSDSMLNSASRFTVVTRSVQYIRSLSDSIMNSVSRFATVTKGVIVDVSVSMMNSVSRLTSIERVFSGSRDISESMMNSVSRFATLFGQKIVIRELSVFIMNAASRFISILNQFFPKRAFRPTVSIENSSKPKLNVGNIDSKPIIKF